MALDGKGFHVDIDMLESAAKAMGEITAKQDKSKIADLWGGDAQGVGSDVLYEALVSFCKTMSEGVDYLVDKAEDTRKGLSEAARTYREADHAAKAHLDADPAVEAVNDVF